MLYDTSTFSAAVARESESIPDREKIPNGTIANRYPTSTRLAEVALETPT